MTPPLSAPIGASPAQEEPTPHGTGCLMGAEVLSRFERRCLCRRTSECGELLQLAVLGVEQAQARAAGDPALGLIAAFLRDAEHAVQQARRLAERLRS